MGSPHARRDRDRDHRSEDRRPRHRRPRSRSRDRSSSKSSAKLPSDRAPRSPRDRRERRDREETRAPRVPRSDDGEGAQNAAEAVEKKGPNFEVSGKLMEDTNVFNGVVIKYSEPPEARKPKRRWRFYVFKGEETLPILHLHRQSAFLMGKDRKIVDLPIDHPSCSRQHAVLQYRLVNGRILPYIIDLGSSNGTFLNNKKIEAKRYYELREKDVLKFGFSSREYVLLHDQSQDGEDD